MQYTPSTTTTKTRKKTRKTHPFLLAYHLGNAGLNIQIIDDVALTRSSLLLRLLRGALGRGLSVHCAGCHTRMSRRRLSSTPAPLAGGRRARSLVRVVLRTPFHGPPPPFPGLGPGGAGSHVRRRGFQLRFVVDLGQTADLQRLGHAEQRSDLFLRHVDLAFVHELDDGFQIRVRDVFEDNDGVLTGVIREEGLEVGAASREDDLVRLYGSAIASQGDVDEPPVLQELVEDVDQVGLVVVPAEAESLLRRLGAGGALRGGLQGCGATPSSAPRAGVVGSVVGVHYHGSCGHTITGCLG